MFSLIACIKRFETRHYEHQGLVDCFPLNFASLNKSCENLSHAFSELYQSKQIHTYIYSGQAVKFLGRESLTL